jgi:hypothetical protein
VLWESGNFGAGKVATRPKLRLLYRGSWKSSFDLLEGKKKVSGQLEASKAGRGLFCDSSCPWIVNVHPALN